MVTNVLSFTLKYYFYNEIVYYRENIWPVFSKFLVKNNSNAIYYGNDVCKYQQLNQVGKIFAFIQLHMNFHIDFSCLFKLLAMISILTC